MRKSTSIIMDIELWKDVKKHCIDKDMDISDYLEELIRKDLNVNHHTLKDVA